MEPVTITVAAVLATLALTKVFDNTSQQIRNDLLEERGKLLSLLKEKVPCTASDIELAQDQPDGKQHGYMVLQMQAAANEDAEIDGAVNNLAKLVESEPSLAEKSKKWAENIGIVVAGGKATINIDNLIVGGMINFFDKLLAPLEKTKVESSDNIKTLIDELKKEIIEVLEQKFSKQSVSLDDLFDRFFRGFEFEDFSVNDSSEKSDVSNVDNSVSLEIEFEDSPVNESSEDSDLPEICMVDESEMGNISMSENSPVDAPLSESKNKNFMNRSHNFSSETLEE